MNGVNRSDVLSSRQRSSGPPRPACVAQCVSRYIEADARFNRTWATQRRAVERHGSTTHPPIWVPVIHRSACCRACQAYAAFGGRLLGGYTRSGRSGCAVRPWPTGSARRASPGEDARGMTFAEPCYHPLPASAPRAPSFTPGALFPPHARISQSGSGTLTHIMTLLWHYIRHPMPRVRT